MELGFHRLRCLAADIWAHLGICRASFPPPPAACATWASREATRRRSALRSLATASSAFLRSERSSGWRSRRLESSHCLALPRTCSKSCARPAPSCESSSQQTRKPLPPHPPPREPRPGWLAAAFPSPNFLEPPEPQPLLTKAENLHEQPPRPASCMASQSASSPS